MVEFTRILVPIDFSPGSRAALRHARAIAERFQASLDVLNVWEPEPFVAPQQLGWVSMDADVFWRNMSQELRERIQTLLSEEVPGFAPTVGVHVQPGYVVHELLRQIDAGRYDLVVMGTHGRSGLSHLLMGSVAERVVRLASVPVLTVRVPKERAQASADARA